MNFFTKLLGVAIGLFASCAYAQGITVFDPVDGSLSVLEVPITSAVDRDGPMRMTGSAVSSIRLQGEAIGGDHMTGIAEPSSQLSGQALGETMQGSGPTSHLLSGEFVPPTPPEATDPLAAALTAGKTLNFHNITFDYDSAVLKSESDRELGIIAQILMDNPDIMVFIAGHTDSRGSSEYNLALSVRRAGAVVDALVTDFGINRDRLRSIGHGEDRLLDLSNSEEGHALNRRVEVVRR